MQSQVRCPVTSCAYAAAYVHSGFSLLTFAAAAGAGCSERAGSLSNPIDGAAPCFPTGALAARLMITVASSSSSSSAAEPVAASESRCAVLAASRPLSRSIELAGTLSDAYAEFAWRATNTVLFMSCDGQQLPSSPLSMCQALPLRQGLSQAVLRTNRASEQKRCVTHLGSRWRQTLATCQDASHQAAVPRHHRVLIVVVVFAMLGIHRKLLCRKS